MHYASLLFLCVDCPIVAAHAAGPLAAVKAHSANFRSYTSSDLGVQTPLAARVVRKA